MTADLLEETIRITERTLAEAEERFPGIQRQISELLLVGGSSRMPAVSAAAAARSSPGSPSLPTRTWRWPRARPCTRRARPCATSRPSWPRAARWPRDSPAPGTRRLACPRPGDRRGRAGRRRADRPGRGTGPRTRQADRRQRAAEGDRASSSSTRRKPGWEDDVDVGVLHRAPRRRADPAALPRTRPSWPARRSPTVQEPSRSRSGNRPGPVPAGSMAANHRVDDAGLIKGLGSFALPAGSPDRHRRSRWTRRAPSTCSPSSRRAARSSTCRVRISILSDEQVDEAKVAARRPDREHLASCRSTRTGYVQDFIKKHGGAARSRRPAGAVRDHAPGYRRGDRRPAQGGPRLLEQDLPGKRRTAPGWPRCAGRRTSGCAPSTARSMETQRLVAAQQAAARSRRLQASIAERWPRNCKQNYGQLGVVTGGTLDRFAAKLEPDPAAGGPGRRAGRPDAGRPGCHPARIRADPRLRARCSRACRECGATSRARSWSTPAPGRSAWSSGTSASRIRPSGWTPWRSTAQINEAEKRGVSRPRTRGAAR